MNRSSPVGMPKLRVPPLGFGMSVRRTGWGTYLPASTAAWIVGQGVFKYAPRSSPVIPSIPGAPWWRLPWWSARRRLSGSNTRSRRSVPATGASSPRVPVAASSPGSPRAARAASRRSGPRSTRNDHAFPFSPARDTVRAFSSSTLRLGLSVAPPFGLGVPPEPRRRRAYYPLC